MCHHAFDAKPGVGTELPESIIDELARFIRRANTFQLHGNGEPLTSKSFWDAIKKIKNTNKGDPWISLNSNATLLTDANIAKLLDAGISHINISLEAASPETYRHIRGASLEKTIRNVPKLTAARNERKAKLKVTINATLMRTNIGELPDMVHLSDSIGPTSWRSGRSMPEKIRSAGNGKCKKAIGFFAMMMKF